MTQIEAIDQLLAALQPVFHEHVGRWELKPDPRLDGGSRLEWSPETFELFEVLPAEFDGTLESFTRRVYPQDLDFVMSAYRQSLESGKPYSIEHRIVTPRSGIKWVHEVCLHLRDASGNIERSVGYVIDITGVRQARQHVAGAERMLRAAINAINEGLLVVAALDRNVVYANDAFCAMVSRSRGDIEGKPISELHPPQYAPAMNRRFDEHGENTAMSTSNLPYLAGDGGVVRASVSSRSFDVGAARYMVGVVKREDDALSRADVVDALVTATNDGLVLADRQARIVWVNDAWCRKTGFAREDVIGENPRFLKSGIQDEGFYRAMWAELLDKGAWEGELWNRRKDGQLYCETLKIRKVDGGEWGRDLFLGIISDISELRDLQRRLRRSESFDSLTGLPSRSHVARMLDEELGAARDSRPMINVLWIDPIGFRFINQTRGLVFGDRVLCALADCIAKAALLPCVAGRASGDEFIVVQPGASSVEDGVVLARQILTAASHIEMEGEKNVDLKLTIGVCSAPQDGDTAAQLFRAAAAACDNARATGALVDIYKEAHLKNAHTEISMLESVRSALARNELFLVFQPKVSLRTRIVEGVEALIRWRDAEGRLIPPGQWIPVLERSDLMPELERWIIREAAREVAKMRAAGVGFRVAVNLSAAAITDPRFSIEVKSILREFRISPQDIQFEVTEGGLMAQREVAAERIRELGEFGIRFAIDDFGTGYSSLAHLQMLPVAELKLDRAFVHGIHRQPRNASVTRAAIAIAQSFDLHTVAEGIEDQADAAYLFKMGCDSVQGFYFFKPMDSAALIQQLGNNNHRAPQAVTSGETVNLLVYCADNDTSAFGEDTMNLLRSMTEVAGVFCRCQHGMPELLRDLAIARVECILLCGSKDPDAILSLARDLQQLYPELRIVLALSESAGADIRRLGGTAGVRQLLALPLDEKQIDGLLRMLTTNHHA